MFVQSFLLSAVKGQKYSYNSGCIQHTKAPSLAPVSCRLLCWWKVEQTNLLVRLKHFFQLFVVSNHGFACQIHPAIVLGGEDPLIGHHT